MSLGTALVCTLAIHPGVKEISDQHPTLLTPNDKLTGAYWFVVYFLQIGFCLVLICARSDASKATLIHGVGMRYAIMNWLIALAVALWTLQLFKSCAVVVIAMTVIVISIHVTLTKYPPSLKHPFDAIFIHAGIALLVAMLFNLTWLHVGSVALDWVIESKKHWGHYRWQATISIAVVNVITAIWECATSQNILPIAAEYVVLCLLLSSPRINPSIPDSGLPKPACEVITLICCLVLHPLAMVASYGLRRQRHQEGRIRLEEEVEEAEARAQQAADNAAAARRRAEAAGVDAPATSD